MDRLESDLRELERSAALETARDSLAYTQFGYVPPVLSHISLSFEPMTWPPHRYVESRTAIQRVEDSKQFLSFEVRFTQRSAFTFFSTINLLYHWAV